MWPQGTSQCLPSFAIRLVPVLPMLMAFLAVFLVPIAVAAVLVPIAVGSFTICRAEVPAVTAVPVVVVVAAASQPHHEAQCHRDGQ